MDLSQIIDIFSNYVQSKFYRFCTFIAVIFLLTSFTTALIEVDVHRLRTTLFLLIFLGAIIWIIDDHKYNYWNNLEADEFSPYCDYTEVMAESAYLDECKRLNIAYLVIGVVIIIVFK